jgi:hypothetical protein
MLCPVSFRKEKLGIMILSHHVGERFVLTCIYKNTDTYEIWYRLKAALDHDNFVVFNFLCSEATIQTIHESIRQG